MLNFLLNGQQANPWPSFILMGVMFVAMYLILFLPQKKQQKRDEAMRNALDIGDEVITSGGIIGRVVSIKDNTVVIESTSDRTKLRFLKNAIVANNTPHAAAAPAEPAKEEKKHKFGKKEEVKSEAKAEEAKAEEVKSEETK